MKLLKTDMYLLLIDDKAEIKRGDYILEKESTINVFPDYLTDLDECDKIIAYRKLNENVKELDLPLLPPFEKDNIVNEVEKIFNEDDINHELYNEKDICNAYKAGIYDGYKAAQSKGQFSLEDVKKAIEFAYNAGRRVERNAVPADFKFETYREELIQSLSTQQLPKEFIPILESYCKCRERGYKCGSLKPETDAYCIQKLKTITNSEGKEEIQGTYKY